MSRPQTDLDVASPDEVPQVLRATADLFREAHERLRADWQDKNAGKVWVQLARIMDRAADQCDKVLP